MNLQENTPVTQIEIDAENLAHQLFKESFHKGMKGGTIEGFRHKYRTLYNKVVIPSLKQLIVNRITLNLHNGLLQQENKDLNTEVIELRKLLLETAEHINKFEHRETDTVLTKIAVTLEKYK